MRLSAAARVLLVLSFIGFGVVLADDYTCSETEPCAIGCCSIYGVCGLGPTYCGGSNCTSSCDYKSECDPGWGAAWSNATDCPLNVCCSQYGFCGTTSDFCGSEVVAEPSCGGSSSDARTVGYYEGWNLERSCQTMEPEDIPLGYYTHINYAFAYIDPDSYKVSAMSSDVAALYTRVTDLKAKQPDLKVWISIGGWSFNDPGSTVSTFSDLAGSDTAQAEFFGSLITFLVKYNFDGVDLDWEYPVADDRGGKEADFDNYPSFLQNLRDALDASGYEFGLSITIPSSYWYMQHFDIVTMDQILDWFNIMTYDLHGTWDSTDEYIGSYALAHTNLTEIELALNLLWRNNIDPAKVNMGLGFYGRSFTMESSSCLAAGCPFTSGGAAGPCTATEGILSVTEIEDIIADGATVTLDEAAAVKIVTWDSDQWVSYDDAETMKLKIEFANSHCLGGTLIWAIDLDLNGTAIDNLGSDLNRTKSETYTNSSVTLMDGAFGSLDTT